MANTPPLSSPWYPFWGLQHINPVAYRSIIALSNGISKRLEHEVNQRVLPSVHMSKMAFGGSRKSAIRLCILRRRAGLRRGAKKRRSEGGLGHVSEMGFSLPEGVHLNLRLEGLFTDAISWSTHCYWLYNRFTKMEDFVGFPAKSGAGRAAKASLSALLPLVAAVCDSSDMSTLHQSVRGPANSW